MSKWLLTRAQAERLFNRGGMQLAEAFDDAKRADRDYVWWGSDAEPHLGEAKLARVSDKDRPFVLEGWGQIYDELLESAGVAFVPDDVIALLYPRALNEFKNRTSIVGPNNSFLLGSLALGDYPPLPLWITAIEGQSKFFIEKL